MGNCSTCCGKTDSNEVSTDKNFKKGGASKKDIDKNPEDIRKKNLSDEMKMQPSNRGY